MVGIPKSNRCSFCKQRKTKCDEAWPTCSTCQRANKLCSGPPNLKFVVNGCHSTSPRHHGKDSTASDRANQIRHVDPPADPEDSSRYPSSFMRIVSVQERTVQDGYSIHRMRLSQSKPQSPPSTTADRLAAKLVYCLDASAGTHRDLQMWGSSLRLMPPRLAESATLRHTIELVITAWSNIQRNLHADAWLDLHLYNKALRSLRQALQDGQGDAASALNITTLASQTLLQKVEIAYDFTRSANQENHSAGLKAVITAGGPRRSYSELGLHLIFENFFTMLKNDVMEGHDSIFTDPAWATALHEAVDMTASHKNNNNTLGQSYHFWVEVAVWPSLVRLLRQLYDDPSDSMLAMELVFRATALLDYLRHLDATVFLQAMDSGDIHEVENWLGSDVLPTCYDFSNYELASWFGTHAFFLITASRILQAASALLGHVDGSVEQLARDFSRRIWMTYPWMKKRKPLELGGVPHLCSTFESGAPAERTMVITALEEIKPSTPDVRWAEATVMAHAMTFSGRLPFVKTDDYGAEILGVGFRSG